MLRNAAAAATLILTAFASAPPLHADSPVEVRFDTPDGQAVQADLYAGGQHAVVLAHGGVFDKESWRQQARAFVAAGLTVLAIDFRGYGEGEPTYGLPGKQYDVLGAIEYLDREGYRRISVVGGSMGGQFAIAAAAQTDRIDLLVLLAPGGSEHATEIRARSTLFITAEADRVRAEVDRAYRAAPQPKRLEIFPGSAHAQHIFATEQGSAVTALMVEFLSTE